MADLVQIEKYLKTKNIKYKVSDLDGGIFRVEDVVKIGINRDEILKTLIVRSTVKEGLAFKDNYVALVLRGKDRVDFKKVRRLFGPSTSLRPSALRPLRLEEVNCELAKPDEVKRVAGVPVGAVCPILLDIPIYFDREAMKLTHINMGSGDLRKGLEMAFGDLLKAVGIYQVEDLVLRCQAISQRSNTRL